MSIQVSKKRKRSEEDVPKEFFANEEFRQGKPNVLEDGDITAATKALKRQAKSERRPKKARHNNLGPAKFAEGEARIASSDRTDATQDLVAAGEDYVPLSTNPSQDSKPSKRKSKQADSLTPTHPTLADGKKDSKPQPDHTSTPKPKKDRFILFVGNLPFNTTTAQLSTYFSKLAPSSIRHRTDPATGRSKGFAFLEFDGYDKMKTCLKVYHHSIFDPNAPPDDEPVRDDANRHAERKQKHPRKDGKGRRINVELTVGGGGNKSAGRKEKLRGKNQKLEEQRERARVKELETKEKESREKAAGKRAGTGANATAVDVKDDDRGDIHPSRRTRVA